MTAATDVLPADRVTAADADGVLLQRLSASGRGTPEAVLHPHDADEVAAVMRWASSTGTGVLPIASGGRLRPTGGGGGETGPWVVLSTDRLSGLEIYEAADLTLTARAGTLMSEVDAALRVNGQWAPFDPPYVGARSLGGLVADGASGPLWTGYGELRNHVLGMTVVTGDGRVLRLGGRVVKNVAGFDLLKPMTGSRGSLAVMTSVTLRAFPVPPEDLVLVARGSSIDELLSFALQVGTAPVLPVSCVVADAGEPTLVVRLHGAPATVVADRATIESHLGITLETPSAEDAGALLDRIRDHAAGMRTVVSASVRPSRLGQLLAAAEALQPAETMIDSYAGLVRFGVPGAAGDMQAFAAEVEALGGATRVERAPDESRSDSGGRAGGREGVLVDRLRLAFDPEGALWPAR